ncbi:MAG: antibiotic biosynthesis monooxygenase [Clostridia bacterium]|nr:antibiotic biosynthesis monooxygenase [Clostridia bacterium]
MIETLVFVDVKPEFVEEFKQITVYNHENSRKEPGNIRFDVLQDNNDPTKFVLVEVFADAEAAAFHKTTEHYNKWRETVAPYMASPRKAMPTTPIAFD